jgi:beta-glucuronidase
MLREMIQADFNHPSIMAWSVANESDIHSPEGIDYVHQMRDWEKSLDPDRYFTFADDLLPSVNDPSKSASQYADFLEWNQYLGTWHGSEAWLPAIIDHVHKTFPAKMVIVSEFGAAGVFGANTIEADKLRVRIFREQLAEFAKYDWIAGALLWCYQDYRSHRNLWPGETSGYVDHGVVDENRQRRPSYDAWKEATSPVRIAIDWDASREYPYGPKGFSARVERRDANEIPSYALHDYVAKWELRDENNALIAHGEKDLGEIGPPALVGTTFTQKNTRVWTLKFGVYRPTGFLAGEREISWRNPEYGGVEKDEMREKGTYPANPPILKVKPPETKP